MHHIHKKFILTEGGLQELRNEYDQLTKVKRPQITSRIQIAREFGDLSENSEYDAAKEEQSLLEARIAQLEEVLPKAQVIQQTLKTDFVVIGSTVVVEMNDEVHEFIIVGSMEADPSARKISNESPVGKALLGLKVGESITVGLGPVATKIKLLEIK
jgi:transcription elongation factor GreA